MSDSLFVVNDQALHAVIGRLRGKVLPIEGEGAQHQFTWGTTNAELANAYLAIVAICHQTSPIGERPLEGFVSGTRRRGWDFLKERFLVAANADLRWIEPSFWTELTPELLAGLYEDPTLGRTLGRVSERCFLLNKLGELLVCSNVRRIVEIFETCKRRFEGTGGFLDVLKRTPAYEDPVRKKALFFSSVAISECGWEPADERPLSSPVDYHEIRGHLRLGTVVCTPLDLRRKLQRGMCLTSAEDVELRRAVQDANDRIAGQLGTSSSRVHYLMWNVFRNCCPRDASRTHCAACPRGCALPSQYRVFGAERKCIFEGVCASAHQGDKAAEPAYIGHYY